jgi:hypothetical protein
MSVYRVEVKISEDGSLNLVGLPFRAGATVNVTIDDDGGAVMENRSYSLRGLPVQYVDPTEPVAAEDWESAR